MTDQAVRFSRLLRIFKLNKNPAFIIELEENRQKTLYISYCHSNEKIRYFRSYNESNLKEEFKNLSAYCLMSQCVDSAAMFYGSSITHFEADCSNVVNSNSMFEGTPLCFISAEFPLVESANYMFSYSKIKEITIDFPKLKSGVSMFYKSPLEKITSKFPVLENGFCMFSKTPLKEINCHFPKIKDKDGMFDGTPPELKQNYPHYFV